MYAQFYNRIVGWLFVTLGIFGFMWTHLGEYLFFTIAEAWICIIFGVSAIFFARHRFRYAVAGAGLLGVLLTAFGFAGLLHFAWLSQLEPLESIVRVVSGLWGIYVALHDIRLWRSQTLVS